jgi:hypothetical protein
MLIPIISIIVITKYVDSNHFDIVHHYTTTPNSFMAPFTTKSAYTVRSPSHFLMRYSLHLDIPRAQPL